MLRAMGESLNQPVVGLAAGLSSAIAHPDGEPPPQHQRRSASDLGGVGGRGVRLVPLGPRGVDDQRRESPGCLLRLPPVAPVRLHHAHWCVTWLRLPEVPGARPWSLV